VLGQEIECRIGLAMSPSHYHRGWHITATCGVFGAAAGSGKLLRLQPEQMVWALGIAATQAAGLCGCLGTPAKSVGVGNAARNGLWSALLAAKDFAGPAEPLTGMQGYYHALAETPQLVLLTGKLGQTWEIAKTSYKPYPCGFVVHPVLDCVLDWRRAHPEAAVEKVTVFGNPLLAARTDRPNISTGGQSQVSVQHAVAAALVTGKAGVAQAFGKTIGIVGIGNVGRRIAELCGGLLRMKVIAYDPYVDAEETGRRGARKVELDELLRIADFVSINCPLTDETRRMIGAREYALMKPTAYFITTARGFIHDEEALEQSLRDKKIAGAALDVWDKEPPPANHSLLKFDNVIATAHTAGVTREARANMGKIAAEQVLDALDGKPVARIVNPQVWPVYAKRFERAFGFAPLR
jgi:D-isomer specific 2-hydroxyacid dehydrogenase, NAD binding domain/MmgE/PrpD N-terminal domain/MmgE/PrpD C-terminal domain